MCSLVMFSCSVNTSNMSSYFNALDYIAQKRYLAKLNIDGCSLQDPYAIEETQWSEDMSKWPDMQFGDIYTYLINTEGCYTKEKLKAFRSLEAYNYFYNGYVRTVYFYLSGRFGILKAKVNPSQKAAENYHEPWIIICMESGSVMTAHCTCMAGLGEVCSHVAAVLFKIEAACRLGYTKPSSTSLPCQWNRDFRTGVTPAEICNVEFVKPTCKRTKPSEYQTNEEAVPSMKNTENTQDVPKIEANKLYSVIHELVPNACLFTIVPIPEHREEESYCSPLLANDRSLINVMPSTDSSSSIRPSTNTSKLPPPNDPLLISSSLTDPLPSPDLSSSSGDTLPSVNPPSSADPLPSFDLPPSSSDALPSVNPPSSLPSFDLPPSSSDSLPSVNPPSSLPSLDLFQLSTYSSPSVNPPSPTDPLPLPLPSFDLPPSSSDSLPSLNPLSLNDPSESFDLSSIQEDKLPKSLADFFKENCKGYEQDIMEKAKQLFYSMHLLEEECMAVEKATRAQRESDTWHQQRYGRLTSSSFHSILTMKKQTASNVADRLLKNKDLSCIPAVKWGIMKEDTARQAYMEEMMLSHQGFSCTKAGLIINPLYPHLGASPDGFVSCSCCGDGLVEIKCPYSVKDDHPDVLRVKPKTFLNEHGLVMTHKYYTQVQGQLLVSEKKYCDFVVWTLRGQVVHRLYPNTNFAEKLQHKLTSFYVQNFLPVLLKHLKVSGVFPSSDISDSPNLYCYCQEGEHGKMIMCENPDCQYVWFHYECVGIRRAHRGSWYCPDCVDK